MSYGGAWQQGWGRAYTVVMGPTHAQMLAKEGWSKADVKQFLWEHYGNTVGELRRFGKSTGLDAEPDDHFHHLTSGPDQIRVVVSGSLNAGITTDRTGSTSLPRIPDRPALFEV